MHAAAVFAAFRFCVPRFLHVEAGANRTTYWGFRNYAHVEIFCWRKPNNQHIFGKLTPRPSDSAVFNGAESFSSDVICSFLKGPYQGVADFGKNYFTALAKNWKKCLKIVASIKNGASNCFIEEKKEAR